MGNCRSVWVCPNSRGFFFAKRSEIWPLHHLIRCDKNSLLVQTSEFESFPAEREITRESTNTSNKKGARNYEIKRGAEQEGKYLEILYSMYVPTDKTFPIFNLWYEGNLSVRVKSTLAAICGLNAKICSLEHKIAGLSVWHHYLA